MALTRPGATKSGLCSLPKKLILQICWEVAYDGNDSASPKELLPSAYTCRYISDPALDVIWDTLPSMSPMFRLLLPEDLRVFRSINTVSRDWFEAERDAIRLELDLLREPTPVDFVRWAKYASRVRRVDASAIRGTFNLSEAQPKEKKQKKKYLSLAPLLASDLIDKLQAHCPTPLLPNIRTLSYCEESFETGDGALVVLPASAQFQPALKAVSLGLALPHVDPDWHVRDIVNRLSLVAPRIERLSLWINVPSFINGLDPLSEGPYSTLRGMGIYRLSSLTSFTVAHISVALEPLLCLGWLPRLRKLDIQPPMDPYGWSFNPRGRRFEFFPALEELRLTGKEGSHQDCIDFLGAITPTSLRTVSLDLRWPEDGTAEALFTSLCVALGGLPCRSTVKDIKMTIGSNIVHGGNIYRSPSLAPLLQLHALDTLTIQGGPKVILDDEMLGAMSHAWPQIRIIRFAWPTPPKTYPVYAPDHPRATLAGLASLVLRCAHLEELEVAFDMRVVPDFDGSPPVSMKNTGVCKVQTLWTTGCVPGDPWAVASFLSFVLPQLSVFAGSRTSYEAWKRTEAFYRQLVALRRQERD